MTKFQTSTAGAEDIFQHIINMLKHRFLTQQAQAARLPMGVELPAKPVSEEGVARLSLARNLLAEYGVARIVQTLPYIHLMHRHRLF